MPVKTACPNCRTPYTLADTSRGKKVRCKHCQEVFAAHDLAEVDPAATGPGGITAQPSAHLPVPVARRTQPTEPLYDARPPRRPRREEANGSALTWILVGSIGGVLLLAGIVVTIILVANAKEPEPPQIVINMPNPEQLFDQLKQKIPPGGFKMPPGFKMPDGKDFFNDLKKKLPPDFKMPDFKMPPQEKKPAGPPAGLFKEAGRRFALDVRASSIKDLAFAPQGKRVGVFYWDEQDAGKKWFDLYQEPTGGRHCHIDVSSVGNNNAMDLSPDGTRVAFVDSAGVKGKALTILSLPDGKTVLSQWNPYPREANKLPQDRFREVLFFAFLDNDRLLTVANNGQYDLWTLAGRNLYSVPVAAKAARRTLNFDGFSRRANNVAISHDRRVLALSNKNGFDLIETASGKALGRTDPLVAQAPGSMVGNEWSVGFSPDDKSLAAKLNVFERGRSQEFVIVWDLATGRKKGAFPMQQNFNTNGPLLWWGPQHVLLCNSNLTEGHLMSLVDGRLLRRCERAGLGRLAGDSPDGRVWYATHTEFGARAELAAVELPQDELARQPVAPGQPLPQWWFRQEGIANVRAGF